LIDQSGPPHDARRVNLPVRLTLLCLAAAALQAWGEQHAPSPAPGPARAAAAAARVRPLLEPALAAKGLQLGDPVFIRAFKEEKLLELFVRHRPSARFVWFRSYPIAAASGTLGPKLTQGDRQVPEGCYAVPPAAMKPDSRYHLAFNLGYPNAYDRIHRRTGDAIMIHGNEVSVGCLAMTDAKIEEIYTLCDAALRGGQGFFQVHVLPFRMSAERMRRVAGEPWQEFWNNLKQGYDIFERTGVPPEVTLDQGHYQFHARQAAPRI
jgi:murein L,D-transpeptidase YafK